MTLLRVILAACLAIATVGQDSRVRAREAPIPIPTPSPHCPTEDSCTTDYRDGAWHIEETTP